MTRNRRRAPREGRGPGLAAIHSSSKVFVMIELSFLVCLAAAPSDCRTERLQFADVSVTTCVLGVQAHLASWREDHPGWEVHGWTCPAQNLTSAEL